MAFSAIPYELFLDILKRLLSDADRQSLRITCRRFLDWIPPPQTPTYFPNFATDRCNNERRAFLRRLFTEGNVFHDRDVHYCGKCIYVKPKKCFSMPNLLVINAKVCDECISDQLRSSLHRGFKLSYPGFEDYYKCRSCGYGAEGSSMYTHSKEDVKYDRRLCEGCHKLKCRDQQCSGWPTGYVKTNWFHFGLPKPEDTDTGEELDSRCLCNRVECYIRRQAARQ